jgi:hypothetical protein
MYPVPIEIVCFHCQQAAEKYFKSFLAYHDQEPPQDLIAFVKTKMPELFKSQQEEC